MPNLTSNMIPGTGTGTGLSTVQEEFLSHWSYEESTRRLVSTKAIETTLNSLYLGDQHKISSGSENIFFTNLSSDVNFFPMWGGLKDQSLAVNQDGTGFIPPSGRVFSDMFSLPLGGEPDPLTSVGYDGDNYFGVNISGLGITTVAAEQIDADIRLEYRIVINGRQVYMQELPRNAARSSAGTVIYPGDSIEWFFDHPVDVRAGTTLNASIQKVRNSDDADLGIFQVRQGDTVDPNTGLLRYQATVHNRLFEDKDLELISPYVKYTAMDFSTDPTGTSILLKDLTLATGEELLIPHNINTLQAIAVGTEIQIKVKGGAKIIIESLPVNAVSINGSFVNAILNSAVTELNNLFTNTLSFASQGNPVLNVLLSENNLTIILTDLSSFSVNISALGVDTNRHVSSGEVVGTDLILTMNDGINPITVDVSNMISGSTMSATNTSWFISYGANANEPVVATSINTTLVGGTELRLQGPYYFGQKLERGQEFKFNINSGNQLRLGIWGGAEVATSYTGTSNQTVASNWNTVFSYANGSGKFTSSSNTDVTSYHASGYTVANNSPMSIRFGSDGHLTLMDLSGGTETVVGRTVIPLAVTEFNMQFGGFNNSFFPSPIIDSADFIWEIVHDYTNTEAGIINGILDHTVLKSALSILPGEKMMFMLDEVGQGDFFGTDYTAAATGVLTAEEQLSNTFKYQTNEAMVFDTAAGVSDWNANTNAPDYFYSASLNQYRDGGAGTVQGLFSLRYLDDNSITIFDEDSNIKIATAKSDGDGSAIHFYMGVRGNRAYYSIPVITKQPIINATQPILAFAPDVSNQSFAVTEGEAFNIQIALDANSDIVNMYGEADAPSWVVLGQVNGQFIGTAPAFVGTSADAYVINCKAANAIGGITNFTVTINVTEVAYTNTKSLSFDGSSTWLQGNPANISTLERASNGDGNYWTISMWVKPSTSTATQTLLVYGQPSGSSSGTITLSQHGGNNVLITYGNSSNKLVILANNSLTVGAWNHLLVTFDGGTTGVNQPDLADYYSRFSVAVNGAVVSQIGSHINNGYSGTISGADASDNIFRIGRDSNVLNNYLDATINQVGIWGSNQSANLATIYNSGATQDLSLLATPPSHYYEIENSATTVSDLIGSADLTGYNFTSGDLVTDAP